MSNWEWKTLQDVCLMKIKDGTHQTPTYCDSKSGFPFLSSKDITSEKINWDNIKYIVPDLHRELYARIAPQKDDVLLAKNGTTGVAALVEDDRVFDIYVTLAVLRPNQKIVLPNYLLRIVNSPICKSQFDSHLKGMGVPNLHLNEIQKVLIPVPPLAEQKRIVKTLDEKFTKIDKLKTAAETNLKNAREIFNAELEKTFHGKDSWKTIRLGDCGTLKNGMNFTASDSGYTIHSLGVGDFKNLYQINDTKTLSKISLKAPPPEDYLLKDGDIVFVRSNGNKELVGRCVLVYPGKTPTTYSGFCIRFRKEFDELDSDFLLHFLKSDQSRKILNGKEGANISNLNQKILSNFEVPLPPLSEQKRIVAHLDKLSEKVKRLEEIYRRTIADCEELKKSILKKTFEGES